MFAYYAYKLGNQVIEQLQGYFDKEKDILVRRFNRAFSGILCLKIGNQVVEHTTDIFWQVNGYFGNKIQQNIKIPVLLLCCHEWKIKLDLT